MCKSCVLAVGELVIRCGQVGGVIHQPGPTRNSLWLNHGFYTPVFQGFSTTASTMFNDFLKVLGRGFPRFTQNLLLLTTN